MGPKTRAIAVEDKEERRSALLDAAEALFLAHPDRMASVAEVARSAGLAKGTVYLYFPSKEEMLLSLHERQVARFFRELDRTIRRRAAVGFDEIWLVARDHIIRRPGYLALTSRCHGMMDRDIPTEAAVAFRLRVAEALARAGAGLEHRLPELGKGGGVTLLQHSYGLIVGLWQLLHPIERFGTAMQRAEFAIYRLDYEREVEQALRSLWGGALGGKAVPAGRGRAK